MFVPHNTEKIRLAYTSKHSFKRKSQVILLMITDGKKWHYLTVKRLSALLKGISSNHVGDFYCLNCFHSYRTKNKLKKHKRVCNNHDYCCLEMPNKDNKVLKYYSEENLLKFPAIIYGDLEFLLEKMHSCEKNLIQRKKNNTFWFFIVYKLLIWCNKKQTWFFKRERLHVKVLQDLRERAMKIIMKKKMTPLTNEKNKSD